MKDEAESTLKELDAMYRWDDVAARKEYVRRLLKYLLVVHKWAEEEDVDEVLRWAGMLLKDGPSHERPQDVAERVQWVLKRWGDVLSLPEYLPILPFEKVHLHVPVLLLFDGLFVPGYLVLTESKLLILLNPTPAERKHPYSVIDIPLLLLKSIQTFEETRGHPITNILQLQMKNSWVAQVCIPDLSLAPVVRSVLESFLPEAYSRKSFFAFRYHAMMVKEVKRCSIDEVLSREYERILLPTKCQGRWRLSNANKNFCISPTMPEVTIVPALVTDDEVKDLAKFRINKRYPMVSWVHKENGACLVRASQPAVGLKNKTSKTDERYMQNIAATPGNFTAVVDARPFKNAVANLANGGGFISLKNYPKCRQVNANIPNIHSMTASLLRLRDLLSGRQPTDEDDWLPKLHASHWMQHIQRILQVSIHIVYMIDKESTSVLVHCTNGWDRTSQIVSLANIMLDSYYRTVDGFLVLHEKDWTSGAHKFGERVGSLGSEAHRAKGVSPIFLQFLECVFQLIEQAPGLFEYTSEFLQYIANSPWEGRVGTYMVNTPQERKNIEKTTLSITEHTRHLIRTAHPSTKNWFNREYLPSNDVLYPSSHPKDLRIWLDYHSMLDKRIKQEIKGMQRYIPPTGVPRWFPDRLADTCLACKTLFTVVTRRHHCRVCGYIFCGSCTYKNAAQGRICTTCVNSETEGAPDSYDKDGFVIVENK
eukprot:TRINITY_DN1312_c0_g1_i1.p1 TRINITY_DN1312_c0_g1~~TRINITY_DN1312_c0_g1_i1.p1  ORF type:complete len:707 (+),score=105.38 TRINITY_DN1312_c0_g1_i1:214-2334(+)